MNSPQPRRRRRSARTRPFLIDLPPAWVSIATGAIPIVLTVQQAIREATR